MYKIYHNPLLHQLLQYDKLEGDLNQLRTYLVIYFTYNFEFNCHILFWAFIYYNVKTFLRNKKMKIQS
jgi:hypothetical protein